MKHTSTHSSRDNSHDGSGSGSVAFSSLRANRAGASHQAINAGSGSSPHAIAAGSNSDGSWPLPLVCCLVASLVLLAVIFGVLYTRRSRRENTTEAALINSLFSPAVSGVSGDANGRPSNDDAASRGSSSAECLWHPASLTRPQSDLDPDQHQDQMSSRVSGFSSTAPNSKPVLVPLHSFGDFPAQWRHTTG